MELEPIRTYYTEGTNGKIFPANDSMILGIGKNLSVK